MEVIVDAFKTIYRRKLRSLLAAAGIAAGVFSFLIMGAMAEHFQRISTQFENLFSNRIFVCEKPSFWAGGGILSEAKEKQISSIPGVKKTVPVLISRWTDERMIVVGLPRVVIGVPPQDISSVMEGFKLIQGRDTLHKNHAVIGFDIAKENHFIAGESVTILDEEFKIAGIMEKTGGLTDGQIIIPLKDAQRIFNREGLVTSIFVEPEPGESAEELSKTLDHQVKGIRVISPAELQTQIKTSLSLWKGLTFTAAITACFAGALCVIITMLVSVSERVMEIGLKKAVGASTYQIIMEIESEALILSILGWMMGGTAAAIFVRFITHYSAMTSNLFDLTIRLYSAAFAGAIIICLLSGFYPAVKAAGIDPVKTLNGRY